jgi:predicted RNA binding protein YcfA (HicA-like mRNA interferase family)
MSKHSKDLEHCKDYKDFERFMLDNGFEYDHSTGGHNFYKPPNCGRSIPLSAHTKEPSKDLLNRLKKEILAAMGLLTIVVVLLIMFIH